MFSMDLKEFYYRSLVNFDNLRIDIKDTRNYINKNMILQWNLKNMATTLKLIIN